MLVVLGSGAPIPPHQPVAPHQSIVRSDMVLYFYLNALCGNMCVHKDDNADRINPGHPQRVGVALHDSPRRMFKNVHFHKGPAESPGARFHLFLAPPCHLAPPGAADLLILSLTAMGAQLIKTPLFAPSVGPGPVGGG